MPHEPSSGVAVPALPSFGDSSRLNLVPFALISAGWLGPLLEFWALVWGLIRPYAYAGADVAPHAGLFLLTCAVCVAPWWLPGSYYEVRRFETTRFYEAVGVRAFRALVPNGDLVNRWRRRRERGFRVLTSRESTLAYLPRTVASEKSHLVLLLAGVGSSLYAWHIGWLGWAAWLAVGNVLVNLYPVLLQRYTRARIDRVLGGGR